MICSATFSPCRRFRYMLEREWGAPRRVAFVMLNPSTADETVDDPTIRKCIGFAKRLGFGALSVVNLYAYRATKPADLRATGDAGRHFVFGDGVSYPVVFRAMYGKASTALLVWDKGRIGMGREFRKRHELVMHAWGARTPIVSSEGTGFADVLTFPPVGDAEKLHPAQKPTELIAALLRVCGRTICDPFMGSGTTGVACMNLGRKFIGIEIEEKYFNIACERIENAQRQGRLIA